MILLIVDDYPGNRKLLRAQMEAEGHVVLEAANGAEGLRVLEREPVEAVISDILMPEMDGFRFCLEIRKNKKFNALPFILYTSTYNSAGDRKLAEDVGADDYLTKPAPTSVILASLQAALSKTDRAAPHHPDEMNVTREYNQALVHKLEHKNLELEATLEKLRAANLEILELNRTLESRVERRTAELQSANRDLESFSYSVSHDLRAPLRAIDGFVRILAREHVDQLPARANELLGLVQKNVKRMGSLIDDLLEFSRLGRRPLSMQRVNMAHLARECVNELLPEQQSRKVEMVIGEIPSCQGDMIMLKQMLLNLIGNALKYTSKQASPRIELNAEIAGEEFIGFVRDNGVGFDMQYAHKLFQVFQRLHGQSEFEGTGVGLAIVKNVIDRHGGRVWAEAAPGQGATFYFSLPVAGAVI